MSIQDLLGKPPKETSSDHVADGEVGPLDDVERAALDAAIMRSLNQSAEGRTGPVEQVLSTLRARRRCRTDDPTPA